MSRGRKPGFYVYCVHDGETPLYVGKGCGRRKEQSARKYGGAVKILETLEDESKAFARERHWIKELCPTENKSPGGNGGRAGPAPLVPRNMRGVVTEAEMRRALREQEAEQREIERVGTRVYAARMLLRLDLAGYVPASKLEAIRQVAYGEGL